MYGHQLSNNGCLYSMSLYRYCSTFPTPRREKCRTRSQHAWIWKLLREVRCICTWCVLFLEHACNISHGSDTSNFIICRTGCRGIGFFGYHEQLDGSTGWRTSSCSCFWLWWRGFWNNTSTTSTSQREDKETWEAYRMQLCICCGCSLSVLCGLFHSLFSFCVHILCTCIHEANAGQLLWSLWMAATKDYSGIVRLQDLADSLATSETSSCVTRLKCMLWCTMLMHLFGSVHTCLGSSFAAWGQTLANHAAELEASYHQVQWLQAGPCITC